ncbi:MAG: NAD-dependent epimerase/dehydratase family protein [Ignavibacteriales bacterium]|nr:NAD-dependent epimerase/dehydratase family protein [Ignavibacteriales bacterium]
MTVLVAGGAGYIGSHTVRELRREGFDVLVLDNLSSGRADLIGDAPLVRADLLDREALRQVFRDAPDRGRPPLRLAHPGRRVLRRSPEILHPQPDHEPQPPRRHARGRHARPHLLFDGGGLRRAPRNAHPRGPTRPARPIPTAGPSSWSRTSSGITSGPTACARSRSATSTRRGPIPTAGPGRMPRSGDPSRAQRPSGRPGQKAPPLRSSGRTSPLPTAPPSGTTSTSPTWPPPTSWP